MADNRYCVDYDKLGRAGCKKCKTKIDKGSVRIGKIVANPFGDGGGDMKQWFHVACMFETLKRARATTKKITDADDLEGWDNLKKEDKDIILLEIRALETNTSHKNGIKTNATKPKQTENKKEAPASPAVSGKKETVKLIKSSPKRDDCFREFRRLCAAIAEEPSYNAKTEIVASFFKKGTSGKGFEGDLLLWVQMLLPGVNKRVYNLQSKQLVKLFAQIFNTDQEEMIVDLEQGDVAETIKTFFEKSTTFTTAKKSILTLQDVSTSLDELSRVTKEDDQIEILKALAKECTSNDLKMVIRLIKHDLRINAGAKHILDSIHPDAYKAFQASRNLPDVIERILDQQRNSDSSKPSMTKSLSIRATLMTAVLPMLAEPCKSIEYALKKCPNGMFAEIKYDGERVQVHKQGNEFKYFSRSLKPVLAHKVQHFEQFIPQAFCRANSLILDSEVLLIDTITGNPLPFGTLGVHKKAAFKDANVCLFVFDCIHYNGENLMDRPLQERKKILQKNMVEVPNRVMFSEMKLIHKPDDLRNMIIKVLEEGLEGLVLKDTLSTYEPGKRHWLKVKKDYLAEGAMADSADLLVLGAFYGTGNKGGMMSIFLMGCYDPMTKKWCTVTKVSGGHDDQTLESLQTELDMVKISKDPTKVPNWLNVSKNLIPDFVCRDPKTSQVWEIVGAEFSKAEAHTAGGISIRFPRVTRIRRDKTWKEATTLPELKDLYKTSKENSDIGKILGNLPDSTSDTSSPEKSRTRTRKPKDKMDGLDESYDEINSVKKTVNKANGSVSSPGRKRKASPSELLILSPNKKAKQKELTSYLGLPSKSRQGLSSDSIIPMEEGEEDHLDKFLPDFFKGIYLYLPKDAKNFEQLKRYVIAYDGNVLEDYQRTKATHWIPSKTPKGNRNEVTVGRRVTEDWLWDCIKLQQLLSPHLYQSSS